MIIEKEFKGHKNYIEIYNNAQDVVNDLKKRQYANKDFAEEEKGRDDRISRDSDWYGVKSREQAYNLLKDGYNVNVSKFDKDMRAHIDGEGKRFCFKNNVQGFAPIVPLSLLNIPNCMIDVTTKPIKAKVIDIIYCNSCNAGTTGSTIIKCGEKLLSAIVQLEMEGYRFNLYATQNYNDETGSDILLLKVKSANQPLDIKRCAFPLIHTAFFRVIGFEWYSKMPKSRYRWGYGGEAESRYGSNFKDWCKTIYGDKAVYITIDKIRNNGVSHIKEMLKYGSSNKN